jgi:hypothetical protein
LLSKKENSLPLQCILTCERLATGSFKLLIGIMRPVGTLLALSRIKANGHFVGVIPLCENMPSGKALKPGDVITARSGTTVEV